MKQIAALAFLISGLFCSCRSAQADLVNFTYTALDVPGATGTAANGINNTGQVVGESFYPINGFVASGSQFTSFSVPPLPPNFSLVDATYPSAINDSGQIVGQFLPVTGYGSFGFELTSRGFMLINPPGAEASVAFGINNAGQIVGYYFDPATGGHGFVDTNGVFTTLDFPNAVTTIAYGINNLGQIVGSYSFGTGTYYGFLYANGAFATLNFSTRSTNPVAINDFGDIVGTRDEGSFLATPDGVVAISVPGSFATFASGINNAGDIAGAFLDGSQTHESGFIATPIPTPEPGSVLLVQAGLIAACIAGTKASRKTNASVA